MLLLVALINALIASPQVYEPIVGRASVEVIDHLRPVPMNHGEDDAVRRTLEVIELPLAQGPDEHTDGAAEDKQGQRDQVIQCAHRDAWGQWAGEEAGRGAELPGAALPGGLCGGTPVP